MNRLISTVLIAGSLSLAGGFTLERLASSVQAQTSENNSSLFYLYNGERIYLTERQDTIAVEFKPTTGTRGTGQPLYLQLQQALQTGTRSSEPPVEVNPLGETHAIVRQATVGRGLARTVANRIRQQPYVQTTLPVLQREEQDEAIVLPNEIILSFRPGLSQAQKQQILQQNNLEVLRPLRFSSDRYLVSATTAVGVQVLEVANRLNQVAGVRSASPNFLQSLADPQLQQISTQTNLPPDLLSFDPPTPAIAARRRETPSNSALPGLQWHLYSPPLRQCLETRGKSPRDCFNLPAEVPKATLPRSDMRVKEAWTASNRGRGVVVAVLDSLIQWDHPDLQPSLYRVTAANKCPREEYGWDFTSTFAHRVTDPCKLGDSDTRINRRELAVLASSFRQSFQLTDAQLLRQHPRLALALRRRNPNLSKEKIATLLRSYLRRRTGAEFHGTWVSGVIAAQPQTPAGMVGVAPQAQILPVRVMGLNGQFFHTSFQEGLAYAADRGADVINISLGGRLPNQGDEELMNDLMKKYPNLVIVASAGNYNETRVVYPAASPGVVAVGATNLVGNRAPYSNFGRGLTLVAPGGDLSTTPFGGIPTTGGTWLADFWQGIPTPTQRWSPVLDPKGEYWWVEGTSFSSPAVAGVVALMKGEDPERKLSRDRLVAILKSTATYSGLSLTRQETNLYVSQMKRRPTPGPSAIQYFFGSGLVNAEAAVREVKRLKP